MATDKAQDKILLDKLIKVLALADSSQEGEAQAALKAARQIMDKLNMNFADLALGAYRAKPRRLLRGDAGENYVQALQEQVRALMQQQAQLHIELEALRQRAQTHQRTAELAAAALAKSRQDNTQWRDLARDTAEKLWDLGHQMESARRHNADTVEGRQRAALRFLEETQALLRKDDGPLASPATPTAPGSERLN